MEPIIALLALIAQHSIRQEALIAALEKKGLLSRAEIEAAMPRTEKEVSSRFDSIKTDFFELWSKFDDSSVQ